MGAVRGWSSRVFGGKAGWGGGGGDRETGRDAAAAAAAAAALISHSRRSSPPHARRDLSFPPICSLAGSTLCSRVRRMILKTGQNDRR